ncbi:hypothetical protein D3C81_1599790 [compost metagenome]
MGIVAVFFMSIGAEACGFAFFEQPPWVDPGKRVGRILVKVQTTGQTNRVRLGKAAYLRIVEAEQVVVQADFAVQVLALEAQVLFFRQAGGALFIPTCAPGQVARRPHDLAGVIGQLLRQAVDVIVVMQHLLVSTQAIHPGQRFVAIVFIQVQRLPAVVLLT